MVSANNAFAINGAGRIGRCIFWAYMALCKEKRALFQLKAINDPHDAQTLLHLLKYDSIYGRFSGNISLLDEQTLLVDGHKIALISERNPRLIDWGRLDIDVVLECTGRLKSRYDLMGHIESGAKHVIVSAPSEGVDETVVLGCNDLCFDFSQTLISIGSCTTNALAPVLKMIDTYSPIESGFLTTIHAYTNDQNLVDNHHGDLRRARNANLSIIPTKTGAAKAIGEVMGHLAGKIHGYALRVPVSQVSAIEVVLNVKDALDLRQWQTYLDHEVQERQGQFVGISYDPLVSIDFTKTTQSAIIDMSLFSCSQKNIKLLAWYDNEWAFSHRMLDVCLQVLQTGKNVSAMKKVGLQLDLHDQVT